MCISAKGMKADRLVPIRFERASGSLQANQDGPFGSAFVWHELHFSVCFFPFQTSYWLIRPVAMDTKTDIKNFEGTAPLHCNFSNKKRQENDARSQHPQRLSMTCSPNIKAKGTNESALLLRVSHSLLFNNSRQTAALIGKVRKNKSKPLFYSQNLLKNIWWEEKNTPKSLCSIHFNKTQM